MLEGLPSEQKAALITTKNQHGISLLSLAFENCFLPLSPVSYTKVIVTMLEGLPPAYKAKLVGKENQHGDSLLGRALRHNRMGLVAVMLEGLPPAQEAALLDGTRQLIRNRELLVRAVLDNDIEEAQRLLTEEHIDPTTAKANGEDVLTITLSTNNPEMSQLLWMFCPLDKKFELVRKQDNTYGSPLERAVHSDHTEVVAAMLAWLPPEQKAELVGKEDSYDGTSLLLNAVHNNNAATVTPMLAGLSPEHKAELVGRENKAGVSPLSHAVFFGNTEIVATMLEGLLPEQKAALVGKKNKYGDSPPLYQAERYGYTQIVGIMLEGLNAEQKATIQCDRPTSFVQKLQGRPTAEQSWAQLALTPSPSSTGKGA
jgi:ankyrin repeat protein